MSIELLSTNCQEIDIEELGEGELVAVQDDGDERHMLRYRNSVVVVIGNRAWTNKHLKNQSLEEFQRIVMSQGYRRRIAVGDLRVRWWGEIF